MTNRVKTALITGLISAMMVTACTDREAERQKQLEREQATREGAERAHDYMQARIADEKAGRKTKITTDRWFANMTFTGCPNVSDWYEKQAAVLKDDFSVNLPARCFVIEPGTLILTPPPERRQAVVHDGHRYKLGKLADGTVFWTDSMDDMSMSPVP